MTGMYVMESRKMRDEFQTNRRTFIRRTAGLGALSATGSFGGCARGGETIGDVVDDGDRGGSRSSDDLGLQPGMQIGLGSTAFVGLAGPSKIDPDEPGGGRLITIEDVAPGGEVTLTWRQTVEREITPETPNTAGVGEPTATPEIEIIEEDGAITATGLDNAHTPYLPMYWPARSVTTETSAIWLSREAFDQLKSTRRTAWSRDVLTRISRLNEAAVQQIREGATEVGEVHLNAEDDFDELELTVDGQTTTMTTIEAYDTFGNGYQILDNEQNPLILEFTYDAVSTGFAGIDAGLWSLIKTVFSGYQVATIQTA